MKPQDFFKKYRVATSAVSALIVFAGLALFRSSSADELRGELSTREAQGARITDNLHNGQRLPAQLEQMDSLTKRIADRLSNPTDVAGNQQYFYKLESDSGVKLTDLHQIAASKSRTAKPKYTQYSTIMYSVTIQGDFNHLVSFLRNLESGSKLSTIAAAEVGVQSKLKTGEDPGPSALLEMNLSIQLLGAP